MREKARKFYIKYIRTRLKNDMQKQRTKMLLWDMYYYRKILGFKNISFADKAKLIAQCIKVDWNIQHAHKPCEIVDVMEAIAAQKNTTNSIVVEAGCWKGGSTAKFSIICNMMGYKLHVYDSFEGVEVGDINSEDAKHESLFYGTYVGPIDMVKNNIAKYGVLDSCVFIKGFFADSMKDFNHKVKVAYIDCDLAKGTKEVIEAILPNLVPSARIFSQDYHIKTINTMLNSQEFWNSLNVATPTVKKLNRNLAVVYFN